MQFDILTIFPEFFQGPLAHGVVARARQAGRLGVNIHNLRDFATDTHRTTDDRPFGGGEGMVMKPEPIAACLESVLGVGPRAGVGVVLLSAQGRMFRQAEARRFSALERLVLICGRYEGVDERVAQHLAQEELSVGDYVLSGGELAAAVVLDATARLLPGVLGHADSSLNESFAEGPAGEGSGWLDCPQYTRPVSWQGLEVPEVLRGGDHAAIRRWRRKEALRKTRRLRPDLLVGRILNGDDRRLMQEIEDEEIGGE